MIDEPVAAALVPYLHGIRCDVMVVSGDFTQRATAGQYREAMEWLKQFGGPKLYVPGNHDVPLYAVWERFFDTFGRYREHVTPNLEPVWEDDELVVMGVATPRAFVPVRNGFWKDGRITEKSLAHVVAGSATRREKFSVVVTHHPFVPPPGHRADGVVLGGRKVMPVLAAAGVNVLLAGHLHASYHEKMDAGNGHAIFSVQAATATSVRRRHAPDGQEYFNAFNVLRCSLQQLEIQLHSFVEGKWSLTSRTVYRREGKGWAEVAGDGAGSTVS
jgi:3',5'-cyclic AMP phosphodiesterase CpdA